VKQTGDDKAAYNEYMRKYMLERYHKRRASAIEQLGGKCVDCGSVEELELDHADHTTKVFNYAKALSGWSEARVQDELKKAVLRCKDHHRLKTTLERGQTPGGRHGAVATYQAGCRCDLCKAAKSAHSKRYRKTSGT
jgi:hypothetical protein